MYFPTLLFALFTSLLAVSAYTPPSPKGPTWGPLLLPDLTHPLTKGKPFKITWDPKGHKTAGTTVSLVLCRGNSNACIPDKKAIVEKIPAGQKSYTWNVPCTLPNGVKNTKTGYGMLVIVDGTGEFQYSTQFSVVGKC